MNKRITTVVFAFFLILTCILFSNVGCGRNQPGKNSTDHDVSDPSEPNIPVVTLPPKQPASILRPDIAALDRSTKCWGQGTIVNDKNCPVGCIQYNQKYGAYDALFGGNPDVGKTVYLTFDEGYENGYTAKILDILKEKNCPAIFFVTMDYAKREPELIRRMIEEGHVVGNHSTTHPSMPSLSADAAAEEILALHKTVMEQFAYQMTLFRPPKGEFSEQTLALAQDLGYRSVFWSFAYKDWVTDAQPEPHAALTKTLSAAHDGAIYLLHAVSETNAAILGQFIDNMRQNGYRFASEF